jgi:hypothetical protein
MTGQSEESVTLKARGKTYFFDIRKTKEGKPYLGITESHLKKESQEPQRDRKLVFRAGKCGTDSRTGYPR